MTAGSEEDLRRIAAPGRRPEAGQSWPTGRHKKTPPPVPTLPPAAASPPAPTPRSVPRIPEQAVFARPVVSHRRPPPPIDLSAPRPRVVDDVSLLGFSRFSRGRVGSRLFRLFFALVFLGILVQLVYSIVEPFVP